MRGRKPKPTKVKELEGNPGRRPLNGREPSRPPIPPDAEPAPGTLGDAGMAEWRRLCEMGSSSGLITDGDTSILFAYCVAYDQLVEAARAVRRVGPVVPTEGGGYKANPLIQVRDRALRELRACAAELGLTPSSRSRVSVPEADEKDDILEFLKGA